MYSASSSSSSTALVLAPPYSGDLSSIRALIPQQSIEHLPGNGVDNRLNRLEEFFFQYAQQNEQDKKQLSGRIKVLAEENEKLKGTTEQLTQQVDDLSQENQQLAAEQRRQANLAFQSKKTQLLFKEVYVDSIVGASILAAGNFAFFGPLCVILLPVGIGGIVATPFIYGGLAYSSSSDAKEKIEGFEAEIKSIEPNLSDEEIFYRALSRFREEMKLKKQKSSSDIIF